MRINFRAAFCASLCVGLIIGATSFPLYANAKSTCGVASWYDLTSRTASGEMMNPAKLTAAHKKLRFGTKVRVKNSRNGRSVIVRINDRGPFIKGRFIDVSKAAAQTLGFINAGTAKVCIEILR